ncbi:PALP domain-containing protein [Fusarium sp. LHS14.1]|nr:PALP domain-containing protein [Fusarium sp. LHS14.1]
MKRVYALGFIFLDVVFRQGAGSAIPGCVGDCLSSTTVGCDSGDVKCLCSAFKRKELIDELLYCVKKGCKPNEAVAAEHLYGSLCGEPIGSKEGTGPPKTTTDANAPPIGGQEVSSTTLSDDTEEVMSTEVDASNMGATSTDDTTTLTSIDPVKAGVAASASTAIVLSEPTASTSTESSTASSTSTEEGQATETVLPVSDKYHPKGGLSAGTKAGIGVGVTLGVIGLGCLVAAIWLMRRRKTVVGASEMGVTHARTAKSSRQVEVAEIDGRPAPQELPA